MGRTGSTRMTRLPGGIMSTDLTCLASGRLLSQNLWWIVLTGIRWSRTPVSSFLSDASLFILLKLGLERLRNTPAFSIFQHKGHSSKLGNWNNALLGGLEISHPFSIQITTKSSSSISKNQRV